MQVLGADQYIPGLGGMAPGAGVSPGGAVSFSMFNPAGQNQSQGPMDKPHMKRLRAKVEEWFNNYLMQPSVRGRPLDPGEEIPPLLMLIMAMKEQEPTRHQCLHSMESLTFGISTSSVVRVPWGRHYFTSVPYAVQQFPIGPAQQILRTAQSTIFDDINLIWDPDRKQQRMRILQPDERIVVSFHRWRKPSPQEQKLLDNDFDIVSKGTMVDMESTASGGALLLSFAPEDTRVEMADAMGVQLPAGVIPQDAGSAAPQSDPNVPPIVQAAAPAAPASQTGLPPAAPPVIPTP